MNYRLVFLSLGGHLVSISILVQGFIAIPVGSGLLSTEAISGFIAFSSQVFIGAIIMVLPIMLGLLMINGCLGVISRASPSLNVFAVGFPALIPIGFGMVLLSIVTIISKMEGLWFQAFQTLNENMFGLYWLKNLKTTKQKNPPRGAWKKPRKMARCCVHRI